MAFEDQKEENRRRPAQPGGKREPVRKRPASQASGSAPRPAGEKRPPARRPEGSPPGKRPPSSQGEVRRRPAPSRERPAGRPSQPGRTAPQGRRPAAGNPPARRSPQRTPGYQPKFAAKRRAQKPTFDGKRIAALLAAVLGIVLVISLGGKLIGKMGQSRKDPAETQMETTLPPLPQVVSQGKITVTGDLLPHKTIYSKGSAVYREEQAYDFTPVFRYLRGYTDTADYAIANLETSLYGPEKPYSGNPKFNTPDAIVDGAKAAGFDLLLTANNHCNDTGIDGVLRTVQVIREKGLTALGTNLDSGEPKYHIQNVGGIQVGMLCYTYEDSQDPNQVTFNYNPLPRDQSDLVCSFPKFINMKSREPFYEQAAAQIRELRQQGAEAIVFFLHWGDEYYLQPNADQRDMAQRLCDLGVDVIVGGHPHVVEPVELLTSRENPEQKTVCLYSLGNAFSNQRREEMKSIKSGHTEDGMLFNMVFSRYSDDSVYLSSVEVIPTWVNKFTNAEEKREYNILPLEESKKEQWQTLFSLDAMTLALAQESYGRTMELVSAGLEQSNQWLRSRLPGGESYDPGA